MKPMMQILVGLALLMSLNAQAQLPDFLELVDDVSPAVVNISTRSSQPSLRPEQMPDLQNLPPFFGNSSNVVCRCHPSRTRRALVGFRFHHLERWLCADKQSRG